MDVLVQEFANVGLTLLCFVVGVLVVNWLDRNVFNKNRRKDD
tara:strand:- start:590 stop:715 length:126 start_codon:yes stop_codon:yes gene_type:complete